jgi:hypothetical protein
MSMLFAFSRLQETPVPCSRNGSGNADGHPCRQVPQFLGPVTVPSAGFVTESFKKARTSEENHRGTVNNLMLVYIIIFFTDVVCANVTVFVYFHPALL